MTFLVFLDFIVSGAFAIAAFLFYLLNKENLKTRREKGMYGGLTRLDQFKSWMIIFFLVLLSLKYFFSFISSI